MAISEVYNEDCMIGIGRYPDKFFDLAIVDPPYGINRDELHNKNKGKWGFKEYHNSNWDKQTPNIDYFLELQRVSKNQIIWGANYYPTCLPPSMGWIFWDKGQYNFSFSDGELAYTSFNRKLKRVFFSRSKMNQENRIHPTQKPIWLYKWLLQNYANYNDKIIDTHMGSQSSRIAAFDMGFDYYGWEIDKGYFDTGNKRFELFKQQQVLF